MKVGVTATQDGLDSLQLEAVRCDLVLLGATEVHHGDCIGGDKQIHDIAKELGIKTVIHPPSDPKKRAFCDGDVILDPKPYLQRNKDIVDATDKLVGCPKGPEVRRSGTWSTIRYAQKKRAADDIIINMRQ